MDRFGRLTRRKSFSLNNNNNSNRNNNRRRGRGNRQQGGGNQNRIDSRARGNAPQMLDKYRKLAQDAQHNGDRVQAEYYLQFADHYFRVIADSRPRTEDGRGQNRNDRDFSNDEDGDEDDLDGQRGGQQGRQREERQQRDDRPRDDRPRDDRPREDRPRDDRPRDDRPREGRGDRNRSQRQQNRRDEAPAEEGETGAEGANDSAFEPAENPFVRSGRTRDARRTRAPRDNARDETAEMTGDAGEIDASALPPSISASTESEGEPTATRKLPPRRRRKPADDEGEGDSLTAVG
jgi:hypothetical protein